MVFQSRLTGPSCFPHSDLYPHNTGPEALSHTPIHPRTPPPTHPSPTRPLEPHSPQGCAHLLLHVGYLPLQPLDHAVQLADLHLDLLQAVSVFPCSHLELFVLPGKRRTVTAWRKPGLSHGKSNTGGANQAAFARRGGLSPIPRGTQGHSQSRAAVVLQTLLLGNGPNFHETKAPAISLDTFWPK